MASPGAKVSLGQVAYLSILGNIWCQECKRVAVTFIYIEPAVCVCVGVLYIGKWQYLLVQSYIYIGSNNPQSAFFEGYLGGEKGTQTTHLHIGARILGKMCSNYTF